ncbi:MAG: beta-ketoacyl synthase N-terminal-like domain-containing protein, partial [Acutalibacteraceae bacterium]|nr:beta-ketoacyl synthase N-terminal-like domain-containing protein [Acutalibacteraceae bacterium]
MGTQKKVDKTTVQINNEVILENVKRFLMDTASALLKIRNVDIDKEMEQYGFDSISYTDFANKINEYYKIDLMPTVLFEFEEPTIRSLAAYLCDKYASQLHSFYEKEQEVEEVAPVSIENDEIVKTNKTVKYFEKQSYSKEPEIENSFNVTSRFVHTEKKDTVSRFIHPEKKEIASNNSSVDREYEPIAIIGMQGAFPQSENLDEFWTNLRDGKQLVTEIPEDRFDWKEFDDPALRWGCFMKDIDKFDADFFGIAKQDAEAMDPQHRLFLQAAWSAIEDAGYKPSDLSGTKTGVFVGIGTRDYSEMMDKYEVEENPYFLSGRSPFMLCNRLSSILNLSGPCEAIDTACSSSLVAVHKAVESIHIGSSEMAIVGGVNVILTPSIHIAFSAAGMLSKTGECRVFDKDADGTVRSEGVGAIILKPLSAAVRDGDNIYALIKATSQNHKGKSASLTSPKANAEADLIMDVFHKAKVDPSTVNYIEAHSTGAKLGDPVEITGLKKAFEELYKESGITPVSQSCAIGSLKANVGHLETASGIGALLKVVLSLQQNQILGVSNFKELNPYIDLTGSPFYINQENRTWDRVSEDIPRRAGISAFGYGGVNAHIMVEEYMGEEIQTTVKVTKNHPAVILLSARNKERLKEQAKLLYNAIDEKQFADSDLANIAYTLQIGRESFEERLAFTAVTINDLKETLSKFINDENASVYVGSVHKKNDIVTMIEQDEEIINSWVVNREYSKLLKLWISGCKIDWGMLYKDEKVKRISLPSYPFEKNRYWLNFGKENTLKQSKKKNKEKFESKQTVKKTAKKKKVSKKIVKKIVVPKTVSLSEIEEAVKDIWKGIIGNDDFTLDDGFFEIGVDSVTAAVVVDKINERFNCNITVTHLFEYSSMRALSAYIAEIKKNETTEESIIYDEEEDESDVVYDEEDDENDVIYDEEEDENNSVEDEENISQQSDIPDYYDDSVAIIGISCEVPGADSYEKFWNNLLGKKECSKYLTKEEQMELRVPKDIMENPNYVPVQFAVEGKELFDPGFFKISPRDAEYMDPQLRHLLQDSWKAVEDAGYIASEIPNTAVYMSASNNHYYNMERREDEGEADIIEDTDSYVKWLYSLCGTIPTMIAYKLGLKGPSYFVHSNCSSGLVAMYQAYQSICAGKVDYALVGASTMHCTPNVGYMHFPGLNTSSDGHVKTFDASADGMVDGEGAAVVLLKNAKKAAEDGDHIYAVLRGIELNNDGSDKVGFYAPSVKGQSEAITKALESTKINPETISYVETHGTGTKLGDPIEFSALCNAYRNYTDKTGFCGIGSVKTNIGHLDTVAGIVGCIKLILSLYHGEIPASLNFKEANKEIDLVNSPFYVVTDTKKLEEKDSPYRAALSSLGIGGTNAHAIFEQYKQKDIVLEDEEEKEYFVPVSAKSEDRLKEYVKNILQFLSEKDDPMLTIKNISYTLQTGRTAMKKRVLFVVKSLAELKEKLTLFVEGQQVIDNCYKKGMKGKISDITTLNESDIKTFIENKENEKIALLWANGKNVDWKLLYEEERPYKVSLPTYPFAKESYWKSESKVAKAKKKQSIPQIKSLHPLVDENISDFMEQKYVKNLTGEECFVADHVVNHQKVLPGVVHVEMARAACELAMKRKVQKIKNVVWARPIIVESPQQVEIALSIKEKGVAFQIRSNQNNESIIHSQGKAEYQDALQSEEVIFDINSCKERCHNYLEGKEFYEANRRTVFDYGTTYQALKEVFIGQDEVLGIIEVPKERRDDFHKFTLHPSLLEGCLHVTGTLMHKKEMRPFMPFTMEEVEIVNELQERCYVYATYAAEKNDNIQNDKFNIWILDTQGRVLVKIKNYSIRTISSEPTPNRRKMDELGTVYCGDEWKRAESDIEIENYTGCLMVFDDSQKLSNTLGKDHQLIQVKTGIEFRSLKNGVYEMNPNVPEHYRRLLRALKAEKCIPNRIV